MNRPGPTVRGATPELGDGSREVELHLAKVPEPALGVLRQIRALIRSVTPPEATECIRYGLPSFKYKGALVAYGAFKNHVSFFPMSASLLDTVKENLKSLRTSKGTLQLPFDKPIPSALLKKLVKARIAQNEQNYKR